MFKDYSGALRAASTGLFVFGAGVAQAAVPTATDDTGTADPGTVEISTFVTGQSRDAGDSYELPAIEFEYGVVDGLAVFIGGARQVEDPDDESSKSGWGNGNVGFKWRFHETDVMEVAVVPTYSFPIEGSSKRRGIIEDVRVLSLPVVAAYMVGDWTYTAQVSYDLSSTSVNGIGYGFKTGYQLGGWLLLGEIYGEELSGSDEGVTNARLGFEYEGIGPGAILFSVGTGLTDDLPEDEELDYEFFVGYRWAVGG